MDIINKDKINNNLSFQSYEEKIINIQKLINIIQNNIINTN